MKIVKSQKIQKIQKSPTLELHQEIIFFLFHPLEALVKKFYGLKILRKNSLIRSFIKSCLKFYLLEVELK